MFAPAVLRPTVPRTLLVLLSALSLLTALTVVFTAPVDAVTLPTVLALSEDCSSDNKQIDWSGNDTEVIGDMHSNAGIHVSGARNDVSGSVTFDGEDCDFEIPGSDNTGGLLSPADGASIADPAFSAPVCNFTFPGPGDTDLHSEDVWLDDDTLKPGVYCKTGPGKLQQSRQHVDGNVSFFAHGHIDLSNGSNADYTAFRADGVLTHSLANSVDAVTLAGSGTDAANNTFYRGIIYAPFGEAETGGQHITIGCIVAETVKLNGSDHTIQGCGEVPPPPPQPRTFLTKTNNTTGPVAPGTSVNFTIVIDVTDGPVPSMQIVDQLPAGIGSASAVSDSGSYNAGTNRITWNLTNVADGETLTYTAVVSATATPGNYVNVATITQGPCVGDGCDDDSTVVVPPPTVTLTPTLVIDKTANTTSITISGPAAAQVATPSSVTWTLNYTLTNGPVTNAVITDPVPVGFDFVSATNSGTFNAGTRTITWNLASPLTTSGSVSFVTNVNLGTISRTGPTVNVATIDSTETAPDTGQDDVTVSVVAPPLASTGGPGTTTTPGSSALPNTAFEIGPLGVMTIPLAVLAMVLVGSLGALGYANVRSVKRRQR
jgi:hypothetical protein